MKADERSGLVFLKDVRLEQFVVAGVEWRGGGGGRGFCHLARCLLKLATPRAWLMVVPCACGRPHGGIGIPAVGSRASGPLVASVSLLPLQILTSVPSSAGERHSVISRTATASGGDSPSEGHVEPAVVKAAAPWGPV